MVTPKERSLIPQYKLNKVLTQEEIKRIIEVTGSFRDGLIFKIWRETGVRNTELRLLRIKDINFQGISIFFLSLKKKKNVYTAKTNKERRNRKKFDDRPLKDIPITKELMSEIKRYMRDFKPKNYLFTNKFGEPLSPQGLGGLVDKYAKKAGVQKKIVAFDKKGRKYYEKRVTPHSFRHSLATYIQREQGDIKLTQQILDHTNITSTQGYLRYTTEDVRKKIEGLF